MIPLHSVIETGVYLASAKGAGMTEGERATIVDVIAADPLAGDVIPGSGGARKVRFAGHGKGKSGGYRVITYFVAEDVPVFLLDVYGKGQKTNLSKAELNEFRTILGKLGPAWRESARRRAAAMRKGDL
jgi:hypothetical protein